MAADRAGAGLWPSQRPMPPWALAGGYKGLADGLRGRGWGCSHPDDDKWGQVPYRLRGAFAGSFDPTASRGAGLAYEAVRQLVAGEIQNLLLSGPPGTGKSHLAAIACNELALDVNAWPERDEYRQRLLRLGLAWPGDGDWGQPGGACPRWLDVTGLLTALKAEFRGADRPVHDWWDRLLAHLSPGESWTGTGPSARQPRLLGLDDVGVLSAWDAGQLHVLVDAAYTGRGPQLVTTNLTLRELRAAGYGREVSRLREGGLVVEMDRATPDYRRRIRGRHRLAPEASPTAFYGLHLPGESWGPPSDPTTWCKRCGHPSCPGIDDCAGCRTCTHGRTDRARDAAHRRDYERAGESYGSQPRRPGCPRCGHLSCPDECDDCVTCAELAQLEVAT